MLQAIGSGAFKAVHVPSEGLYKGADLASLNPILGDCTEATCFMVKTVVFWLVNSTTAIAGRQRIASLLLEFPTSIHSLLSSS